MLVGVGVGVGVDVGAIGGGGFVGTFSLIYPDASTLGVGNVLPGDVVMRDTPHRNNTNAHIDTIPDITRFPRPGLGLGGGAGVDV
jgi:hypothetical protein